MLENRVTVQQTSHRCIEAGGVIARENRPLSRVTMRSKQGTMPLGRFDLGIDLGRTTHGHDQFIAETLVASFSVLMNEQNSYGFARRVLAKENQFVKAIGQVCYSVVKSNRGDQHNGI